MCFHSNNLIATINFQETSGNIFFFFEKKGAAARNSLCGEEKNTLDWNEEKVSWGIILFLHASIAMYGLKSLSEVSWIFFSFLSFFFVFKFFMRMENFLLCFWNWNFCWEHFRSPEGNLALRSFRSHENLIWKGWKITIIALMIYSKHFCYCLLGNCLFLYEHFTRLGMKFLWKMEFSANN